MSNRVKPYRPPFVPRNEVDLEPGKHVTRPVELAQPRVVKPPPVDKKSIAALCVRTVSLVLLAVFGDMDRWPLVARGTNWVWDDPAQPAWASNHNGQFNVAHAKDTCRPVPAPPISVVVLLLLGLCVVDDWGAVWSRGGGIAPTIRQAGGELALPLNP